MRFGENEVEVGELDANKTVALIKFVSHVYGEMGSEDKTQLKGWESFINILSPQHLYDLTAIVTGLTKKEVTEHWTFALFIEMISELSEANDLSALMGNLQRVVGAFTG